VGYVILDRDLGVVSTGVHHCDAATLDRACDVLNTDPAADGAPYRVAEVRWAFDPSHEPRRT
jgi:hypothetical protein